MKAICFSPFGQQKGQRYPLPFLTLCEAREAVLKVRWEFLQWFT